MNEVEFTIRDIQAEPAELEQLLEIEGLCFNQADAWADKDFKKSLNTSPDFCITAESSGRILGSIFGRIQRYRLSIDSCAIHPDYRRRGIAAALLAELEKRAKAFSIHELDLKVRPSNSPALAFWQEMGFEQFEISPGYYLDGEDALLMHKKLG